MDQQPQLTDPWPTWAAFYRRQLVEQVMPFWERNSPDREHGGYLHRLDREGRPTAYEKRGWCQGRQTYMFAALYRQLEPRPAWLELARLGRDFMVQHMHLGDGRWAYESDRHGRITEARRSLFTDLFVLMGLCEFAAASGQQADRALIEQTFAGILRNLRTPGFNEYHHFPLDPRFVWHGPWMALIGVVPIVRSVLGDRAVAGIADEALERILQFFVRDDQAMLFELLNPDGSVVETEQGLRTNPGHALESMWFCMEEAQVRGEPQRVARAIQVAQWAFTKGWDSEYGGLFAFVAPGGGKPRGPEEIAFGERWDHKVWWVHAEALYTAALAAQVTGSAQWKQRLADLHAYTFAHFPDLEFGDWYEYLDRSTHRPTYTDKGKWIKCAFHIPRALLKLALLPERAKS